MLFVVCMGLSSLVFFFVWTCLVFFILCVALSSVVCFLYAKC